MKLSTLSGTFHCMARPPVTNGGDALRVWRVVANMLKEKSLTVYKA
jgi:hypothetical protein